MVDAMSLLWMKLYDMLFNVFVFNGSVKGSLMKLLFDVFKGFYIMMVY